MTSNKARKCNGAASKSSKATNKDVHEKVMEFEEKIKLLKEEFNSLPRAIRKTLCADAVDGDVTKARKWLDRRDAGKLNGGFNNSFV